MAFAVHMPLRKGAVILVPTMSDRDDLQMLTR